MVDWTAPLGGGDVTVYASGLAAAGSTGTSGDQYAGASLTIPRPKSWWKSADAPTTLRNYNPEAAFDDGSCEVVSCALQGDLNGDLAVTTSDLLIFLSVFGETL